MLLGLAQGAKNGRLTIQVCHRWTIRVAFPMTSFADRTIWTGDYQDNQRGFDAASVCVNYLEQLFNSNRNYAAPVASTIVGAAFKGT